MVDKLLSYTEWMAVNKFWAGKTLYAKQYYASLYGQYCKKWKQKHKEIS